MSEIEQKALAIMAALISGRYGDFPAGSPGDSLSSRRKLMAIYRMAVELAKDMPPA